MYIIKHVQVPLSKYGNANSRHLRPPMDSLPQTSHSSHTSLACRSYRTRSPSTPCNQAREADKFSTSSILSGNSHWHSSLNLQ